jgi:copper chaperone CopZ
MTEDRQTYSLGAQPEATDGDAGDEPDPEEEAMGVPIPDEHVGAFVAEAFEDPERSTAWDEVVDQMVAPAARDAWAELSAAEQTVEVLDKAAEYDRRAADELERIPTNKPEATPEIRSAFEEAKRLRRNADAFRDGVASAYQSGRIDDDELVGAVDESDFDTEQIAAREDELESVTAAYGFDYSPYGGTLFDEDKRPDGDEGGPDPDIPETF